MPTLFDRIQSGIVTGAALWIGGTGCSTGLSVERASDASSDTGVDLQPYPLDALACGFGDAGLGGYCCHSVTCVVVEGTCPMNPFPYELGQPGCEGSGPFAPNPEDPNPPAPGDCCYITGSIVVEGRPLFVDHAMLVAAVVTRGDWLLA